MKALRYILGLAIALSMASTPLAWADVSVQGGQIGPSTAPLKRIVVIADTNSAGTLGPGSSIVGFKLISGSAGGFCELYDAATVTGTPIDDLQEATADETNLHIWPSPYVLATDLSINVAPDSTCIVYYY